MQVESTQKADDELARSLAQLWPHRTHESSALKSFLCLAGFHRWARLDLSLQAPGREVRFCRWCDRIVIDGRHFGS